MKFSFFRLSNNSRPPTPFEPKEPVVCPTLPSATPFTGKTILVVDDDPVVLKAMSIKLASWGYAVTTAADASSAIASVRDKTPDLIIMDVNFPPDVANGGMVTWDGFQIMTWLRSLSEVSRVPFIIMAGGDPSRYEKRSLASHAVAFFPKPIPHDALLNAIQQALDKPAPVSNAA